MAIECKQCHSGVLHSIDVAFLRLTQRPRVRFLAPPKKLFNVAEIYWPPWLEEYVQWLENVDGTHLVLASGKLELQKVMLEQFFLSFNYVLLV